MDKFCIFLVCLCLCLFGAGLGLVVKNAKNAKPTNKKQNTRVPSSTAPATSKPTSKKSTPLLALGFVLIVLSFLAAYYFSNRCFSKPKTTNAVYTRVNPGRTRRTGPDIDTLTTLGRFLGY